MAHSPQSDKPQSFLEEDLEQKNRDPEPGFWRFYPAYIEKIGLLPRTEKLFVIIFSMLNQKGVVFASNAWFADQLGCSVDTVKRAMNSLKEKKLIYVSYERYGQNRMKLRRYIGIYQLKFLAEGAQMHPSGGAQMHPIHKEGLYKEITPPNPPQGGVVAGGKKEPSPTPKPPLGGFRTKASEEKSFGDKLAALGLSSEHIRDAETLLKRKPEELKQKENPEGYLIWLAQRGELPTFIERMRDLAQRITKRRKWVQEKKYYCQGGYMMDLGHAVVIEDGSSEKVISYEKEHPLWNENGL